jgi:DNA-binding XRE family transcriptional regulator
MWNWHITIHGDVANWLIAFGTIALATAAWIALIQLREVKRDRHAQVLMHLFERWNSELIVEALQAEGQLTKAELAEVVVTAWTSTNDKEADKATSQLALMLRIPDYFEALAVLMDVSKLSPQTVGEIYKGMVLVEWEFWGPAIDKLRDTSIGGDEFAYTWWQRLAREMESVVDR